jgi:hypothetical protein
MTGPVTDHVFTGAHGTDAERVCPGRTTWPGSGDVKEGDRRMAEHSGEPQVTAEVGAELISLMVPDVDLELVQLMLSRAARSAAGGRADHQGHRGRGGKPQAALLQEYAELLALIRDSGIDRAQLYAILGLDPETLSADDGNSHPPIP